MIEIIDQRKADVEDGLRRLSIQQDWVARQIIANEGALQLLNELKTELPEEDKPNA